MLCALAFVNVFLANNTASLVDNSLKLDDVEMVASAQENTEPGGGGGYYPGNLNHWEPSSIENCQFNTQQFNYSDGSVTEIYTQAGDMISICRLGGTTNCRLGDRKVEPYVSQCAYECEKTNNGGYNCDRIELFNTFGF